MLCDEKFARLYPITRTSELAAMMALSPSQVRKRAQRRGLRKSPEILFVERSLIHKGRSPSPETRQKLRSALTGRRASDETRAKLSGLRRAASAAARGISLQDWMPSTQPGRMTPEYYAWRNRVYERDKYRCQDCGYEGDARRRAVYAHHIRDWANYPDARYDVANGVTVCFSCHCQRHGWQAAPAEPVLCACGCDSLLPATDRWGRKRRFINGHWVRTRPMTEAIKQKMSAARKGKPLTPEHAAQSAAHVRALRAAGRCSGPEVRPKISAAKMGHAVSIETRQKLRVAALARHAQRLALGEPPDCCVPQQSAPGCAQTRLATGERL